MKNQKSMRALARILCTMLIAGILHSCQKEEADASSELTTSVSQTEEGAEEGLVSSLGEIMTIQWNGSPLRVTKIGDEYFQGDMQFYPDDPNNSEKSTGRLDGLWPGAVVHYVISGGLPNQQRVRTAIAEWEAKTRIRFVRRTNQAAYVEFVRGNGCSSFVGRTGRRQAITLADGCSAGSTIHEIGHAIGLFHEQARKDRDRFININYGNIQDGKTHNFDTWERRGFNGGDLTSNFDFSSIMLYGSGAFSKNGQPTITRKDGSTYSTNRSSLSSGDVAGAVRLYGANTNGGGDLTGKVVGTVSFRGSNGRYISSENGDQPLTINRTGVGVWERFQLIRLDGEGIRYAFRGNNGRYISADNGTRKMSCTRTRILAQEVFRFNTAPGANTFYIKGYNNKFVSSNDGNEELGLRCDRDSGDLWERFTLTYY